MVLLAPYPWLQAGALPGRWVGSMVRRLLLTASALMFSGCLLPTQGTPVFVDLRAGDFWSGRGVLTEVSEDQSRCRVSVRDRALLVKDFWVDCAWIHPRHCR